ncbi:MAG: HU family DNA-binding protein [Prevotellaceae bacterium]|jgi:predicted histone-like DNA-binding protein|nr:HU family DNA-binding protein [Prevotellaceae bacterium]
MGIPFKKILRANPLKPESTPRYFAQLLRIGKPVTLEELAYSMKNSSSLSEGDIQSVITNFVEAMLDKLYEGHSVNIRNFGIFSLSAHSTGSVDRKECTAQDITRVYIRFRPANTVRPDLNATRAGERIEFYDVETLMGKDNPKTPEQPGGGEEKPGENPGEENPGGGEDGKWE